MRFIDNPDTVGCEAVTRGLAEQMAGDSRALIAELGDPREGIELDTQIDVCANPPPAQAMAAARQQMFTVLAVYAFLESVLDRDADGRAAARHYLTATLAQENGAEVAVAVAPGATAGDTHGTL